MFDSEILFEMIFFFDIPLKMYGTNCVFSFLSIAIISEIKIKSTKNGE
jgi:hypothetical protein